MNSFNIAAAAKNFAKNVRGSTAQQSRAVGKQDNRTSKNPHTLGLPSPKSATKGLLSTPKGLNQRRNSCMFGAAGQKTMEFGTSSEKTGVSPTVSTFTSFGGERSGATIRAIYKQIREMLQSNKVSLRLPPDEKKGEVKGKASLKNLFTIVRKATAAVLHRKLIAALFMDALDESQLRRKLAGHVDSQLLDKIKTSATASGATDLLEFRNIRVIVEIICKAEDFDKVKYPTLDSQLSRILGKFISLETMSDGAKNGFKKMRKAFDDRDAGMQIDMNQLEEQLSQLQDLAEDFSAGLDELRTALKKFGVTDATLEQWKPLLGLTSETCWFHTLIHKPSPNAVNKNKRKQKNDVVKYNTDICENLIKDYFKDADKFAESTEIKLAQEKAEAERRSSVTKRRSTLENRLSLTEGRSSVRLSLTKIGDFNLPGEASAPVESMNMTLQRRKAVVKFNETEDVAVSSRGLLQGLVKKRVLQSGASNIRKQLDSSDQSRSRKSEAGLDLGGVITARRSLVSTAQRTSVVAGRRTLNDFLPQNMDLGALRQGNNRATLSNQQLNFFADTTNDVGSESTGSSSGDWIAEVVGRESTRGFGKGGPRKSQARESLEKEQRLKRSSSKERGSLASDRHSQEYKDLTDDLDGSKSDDESDSNESMISSEHEEVFQVPEGWGPVPPPEPVPKEKPPIIAESNLSKIDRFKEMLRKAKSKKGPKTSCSGSTASTGLSQLFRTGGLREPGLGPRYMMNATTIDDVLTHRRELQEHINGPEDEPAASKLTEGSRSPLDDHPYSSPPRWDSKSMTYNPVDTGKLNWMAVAAGIASARGHKFKSWLMDDSKHLQFELSEQWNLAAAEHGKRDDAPAQDVESRRQAKLLGSVTRYACMDPEGVQEMAPRSPKMLHVVCTQGDDFPKLKKEFLSHSIALWGQENSTSKAHKYKSAPISTIPESLRSPGVDDT